MLTLHGNALPFITEFSENAARVYTLLDQAGQSVTMSEVARKTGMPLGDIGRARQELITAGVVEIEKTAPFGMVLVGGAS